MPSTIPTQLLDLFEKKAFALLATTMSDGSPQVTPVWCDLQDGKICINSAKGRTKDRNLRRDPRVALTLMDPDNPYRYLQVRGKVVEITEDGADGHIDSLAMKYLGVDSYPYRTDSEVRVIYRIAPGSVSYADPG